MKRMVILVCLALTAGLAIVAYVQESRLEPSRWSPRLANVIGTGEVVTGFGLELPDGRPPEVYTEWQGKEYRYVLPKDFRENLKKIVDAVGMTQPVLFRTADGPTIGLALLSVKEGRFYHLPREVRQEPLKF